MWIIQGTLRVLSPDLSNMICITERYFSPSPLFLKNVQQRAKEDLPLEFIYTFIFVPLVEMEMRGISASRILRVQIKIKYATKIILVPSFLQCNTERTDYYQIRNRYAVFICFGSSGKGIRWILSSSTEDKEQWMINKLSFFWSRDSKTKVCDPNSTSEGIR